jgi:hypothetical protein
MSAKGIQAGDVGGKSDAYVTVAYGNTVAGKTKPITSLTPVWNETFKVRVSEPDALQPIKFTLFDQDTLSKDDSLGHFTVNPAELTTKPGEWAIDRAFPIQTGGEADGGTMHVLLAYIPSGANVTLKTPVPSQEPPKAKLTGTLHLHV